MKRQITGFTEAELAQLLAKAGAPSTSRARALKRWLYKGEGLALPAALPAEITGVSRRVLEPVRDQISMPQLAVKGATHSADGTVKLLLNAGDAPLETVVIPADGRTTVCVSSQSGCVRGCTFCATALMGLGRNLTAGEIVAQVMLATSYTLPDHPLRNVVFMGMGEPMDNLDEVLRAATILSEDCGIGVSRRHITVSSVGVLPKMEQFMAARLGRLAISLNATTDQARDKIMPVNRRWPLSEIVAFVDRWATRAAPILIAYILMAGVNDSDEDADRLAALFSGKHVRVNLIPLNPHEGSPFARPDGARVNAFHARLLRQGIVVFTRTTRGDEIAAACGQLHRADSKTGPSMTLAAGAAQG